MHELLQICTIVGGRDVSYYFRGPSQADLCISMVYCRLVRLVHRAEAEIHEALQEGRAKFISWTEIADKLKAQRTPDQCRLHWRSVQSGRGHACKEEIGLQVQPPGQAAGGKEWVWKR